MRHGALGRQVVLGGLAVALGSIGLGACEGSLSGSGEDAYVAPGTDAYVLPGTDAYVAPGVDAYTAAEPDAYIEPLGDCTMGTPLAEPIAGCMPTPMASTGDPAEDCVRRINQFRCECQHLPPLMRWRDGEACADQMAQYDAMNPDPPHAGFRAGICEGGYAQNECPGWPGVSSTISGCLQQMWDEGPGEPFIEHGHYINMSSTRYSMVACGFYTDGSGRVWAAQNFR
jgi:hypothetical protein